MDRETQAFLEKTKESTYGKAREAAALVEALDTVRESIEMEAADMAYKFGLGAGEWEAFIDRTKHYQQWKQISAILSAIEKEAGGA